MQLTSEAYYWLAGGFVGALLVDLVATRLFLEVAQPASAYVFHAGRAGKLAGLTAWLAFLAAVWYPRFMVGERESTPGWLTPMVLTVFVLVLLAAMATFPRAAGRGGDA